MQRVSARRVLPNRLLHAARRARGVAVGDLVIAAGPLKLGMLGGNRFDIVLRRVEGEESAVRHKAEGLARRGFVNYFGLQRFGTTSVPTFAVGRCIIRREWANVRTLLPRMHPRARKRRSCRTCTRTRAHRPYDSSCRRGRARTSAWCRRGTCTWRATMRRPPPAPCPTDIGRSSSCWKPWPSMDRRTTPAHSTCVCPEL